MVGSAALLCGLATADTGALAQSPAELAAQRYDVDPMHSSVAFAATLLGAIKVRGRFTRWASTIIYDPKHVERSSVSTVIQVKSLTTDMDFRDKHLRSPDFFDAAQFPTIEFRSDQVEPHPGGMTISGTLTMHGVSRRVTFPAKLLLGPRVSENGIPAVVFSAELMLSRAAFGIAGTNKFNPDYHPLTAMLSDSVDITLDIDAERQTYASQQLGWGTPPGVDDTINTVLKARGVAAALESYRTLRATRPAAFRYDASQLDVLGHQLAERGDFPGALAMLQYNAGQFADSEGVLESLGEVQAFANDRAAALATYRRALAKFPESASAREMVRHLAAPQS